MAAAYRVHRYSVRRVKTRGVGGVVDNTGIGGAVHSDTGDACNAKKDVRWCRVQDVSSAGLVEYERAWQWQRAQVHERLEADNARERSDSGSPGTSGRDVDALLLLQHEPIYTLGRGGLDEHVLFDPAAPGAARVLRADRGGEATYHGPGQLVLYPIIDLTHHGRDIHEYMRRLEEVVIRALHECTHGRVSASREKGLTGVWVDGEKVAAIGVGMRRWIAFHGVAVNVDPDLRAFSSIVPCGIADKGVCSLRSLLGEDAPDMSDVAESVKRTFADVFDVHIEETQKLLTHHDDDDDDDDDHDDDEHDNECTRVQPP